MVGAQFIISSGNAGIEVFLGLCTSVMIPLLCREDTLFDSKSIVTKQAPVYAKKEERTLMQLKCMMIIATTHEMSEVRERELNR